VIELTKEDLTGDLLYSTILGYFAANEASQKIEQRTAGAVAYRKPSFGHFGVSAKVKYYYGIPRQVSFPGLMMDVDHWKDTAVMKDNDTQKKIAFVRQMSTRLSAYEHLVPEKFWTNEQNPGEGVSAVKALAKAAAAGQKIYTLTAQNAAMVYRLQIDDAIRMEIQNALNAGRTVTVHEAPITVSGWTGTGYIIDDQATGAGAYKISGGENGGAFSYGARLGIMAVLTILMFGFAWIVPFATVFPAYLAIGLLGEIAHAASMFEDDPELRDCFWGGFFMGLDGMAIIVGTLLIGPLAALLLGSLSWFIGSAIIPNSTAGQCRAWIWQRW
jgi:hypothetical protein